MACWINEQVSSLPYINDHQMISAFYFSKLVVSGLLTHWPHFFSPKDNITLPLEGHAFLSSSSVDVNPVILELALYSVCESVYPGPPQIFSIIVSQYRICGAE